MGLHDRIYRRPYTSTPADFYRVVDGFILTSKYEGFSLALLEALAANLPVILSDAPGNRDLFSQPLSHCWHAAIGDVDGFARSIVDWHDRLTWDGASEVNHRELARDRFDLRDRFGAVLRLYHHLLGKRMSARPGGDLIPAHRSSN
jgi:glycosyltransferase involved in cell wall biosynthesis